MNIEIGYSILKPVTTQEECNAYTAMAEAVNQHNASCGVGDQLWEIEDNEYAYIVSEGHIVEKPKTTEISNVPSNDTLAQQITNIQLALCELYEGGIVNG